MLVGGKDEDNFMDPKEGDEGERGFGQPERAEGVPSGSEYERAGAQMQAAKSCELISG